MSLDQKKSADWSIKRKLELRKVLLDIIIYVNPEMDFLFEIKLE